jgi:colicin import membrane protein
VPGESLVFLVIVLVFAIVQGLARAWTQSAKAQAERASRPEPMIEPGDPEESEWEPSPEFALPVVIESTPVPPKVMAPPPPAPPPPAPALPDALPAFAIPAPRPQRSEPRERPRWTRERALRRPGEPLVLPTMDIAGSRQAILPTDRAELRRAVVLMTLLGPPRALEPPGHRH